MRTRAIVKVLSVAVALAALVACGDSPTNPTPGPVINPAPIPPPESVSASLEIEGPEVVPLGQTVQFTVMLRTTGGSRRDVTNEATWHPWSGSTVSIDAPGLVAGRERGPGGFDVQYENLRASQFVTVLPAGTFRLVVQVTEDGTPSGPVVGALIEVIRGVGKGLTADVGNFGDYWLYGVAGEIELKVSKNGYRTVTETVMVSDHNQGHNIELALLDARPNVAGTYTLTISAAEPCQAALPAEARTRTYTAEVQQDGPTLRVSLTGATFLPSLDRFNGRVEPGRVVFDFTWYDGEGPYVVERVPSLGLLTIDGIAVVTGSGDRFAGTLDGVFRVFNSDSIRGEPSAYCLSGPHGFVLSR